VPNARIRPATVLDAHAVADVHLTCWRETFGDRITADVYAEREANAPGEWQAELAEPARSATWVADREGTVVGFAHAVATGAKEVRPLELRHLFVPVAEQGRRTGTHLLELAIGDAPCQLWVVEDNEQAIGFYRRHSFELDGADREGVGGLPEVRMVR